ncbi:MAG: hypothetical protein ACYTBV_19395 [Planctomycetota bacterium]|jgi:hypothetical protein
MSDVGLVVLGWFLGVVSAAGAEAIRLLGKHQRKKKMQKVIDLFVSGTKLRNRGQGISPQNESEDWLKEWETWYDRLESTINEVDPIRGANVTNLVNFPLLNFPNVSQLLQYKLSQLTETLQRLQVFISS